MRVDLAADEPVAHARQYHQRFAKEELRQGFRCGKYMPQQKHAGQQPDLADDQQAAFHLTATSPPALSPVGGEGAWSLFVLLSSFYVACLSDPCSSRRSCRTRII